MASPSRRRHRRSSRVPPVAIVVTVAAAALTPLASYAQVNVEALRNDDPPIGRSGTFGGDLAIRTGNVDFVQVGLDARLYDVSPSVTRLLVGNGGLGFLSRSRFASSGLLHYRETYSPWHGLSPEWYGQLNYDRAQLLGMRALAGAGVRAEFVSGEWGEFGAGTALMLEHERLILPDTAAHPDRTTGLRWSNFLTLRVVPTETMVITSTTYFQPEFRNPADSRLLENLRIRTEVTETVALVVSFDLRWDSRPPDGIASLDTNLRTGITVTY